MKNLTGALLLCLMAFTAQSQLKPATAFSMNVVGKELGNTFQHGNFIYTAVIDTGSKVVELYAYNAKTGGGNMVVKRSFNGGEARVYFNAMNGNVLVSVSPQRSGDKLILFTVKDDKLIKEVENADFVVTQLPFAGIRYVYFRGYGRSASVLAFDTQTGKFGTQRILSLRDLYFTQNDSFFFWNPNMGRLMGFIGESLLWGGDTIPIEKIGYATVSSYGTVYFQGFKNESLYRKEAGKGKVELVHEFLNQKDTSRWLRVGVLGKGIYIKDYGRLGEYKTYYLDDSMSKPTYVTSYRGDFPLALGADKGVTFNGTKAMVFNLDGTDSMETTVLNAKEEPTIVDYTSFYNDVDKGELYWLCQDNSNQEYHIGKMSNGGDKTAFHNASPFEYYNDTLGYHSVGNLYFVNGDVYVRVLNDLEYKLVRFASKVANTKFISFYDKNKNGVKDSWETTFNELVVNESKSFFHLKSDQNGEMSIDLVAGKYQFSPEVPTNWKLSTQSNMKIDLDRSGDTVLHIGFYPKKPSDEVSGITSGLPTRCGFNAWMRPKVINSGTTSLKGKLKITLDSLIKIDSFDIQPDSTLANNTFVWNFDTIYPTHFKAVRMHYRVPGVEFRGELLQITPEYSGRNAAQQVVVKADSLQWEVNCSFDPNDKTVWPQRTDLNDQTLFTEALTYRIRFQNTGEDTAFNVLIPDTLSEYLDWSTFKVMDYSHPLETQFYDNGLVEFRFKDILLPDSNVNEPESHGFVTYSIKAKSGLDPFTEIENTGHIFFDFNPAVVTNTTRNVMVDQIVGVPSPAVSLERLQVFPNPAKNQIRILYDNNVPAILSIATVDGREVRFIENLNDLKTVDVSQLAEGMYLLTLDQLGNRSSTLFVKQ